MNAKFFLKSIQRLFYLKMIGPKEFVSLECPKSSITLAKKALVGLADGQSPGDLGGVVRNAQGLSAGPVP